jgi:hypothetical protein
MVNGSWIQIQKLRASDGAEFDQFGASVSLFGTRAVVGAPLDDDHGDGAGAAYVFERSLDAGWIEVQKLSPGSGLAGDAFGTSVSMFGEEIVLGAPGKDGNGSEAGAVYLYERHAVGGWFLETQFQPFFNGELDRYGISVSFWGDRFAAGAWGADEDQFGHVGDFAGAVYISERNNGTWNLTNRIQASDKAAGAFFGHSVSLASDRVLVGAHGTGGNLAGAAYVFEARGSSYTTWEETAKLLPGDTDPAGDEFGKAVCLSPDRAWIGAALDEDQGAASGSAYLFELDPGGGWSQVSELATSNQTAGDQLGAAAAFSGDRVLVGALAGDGSVPDSGATYVYDVGLGQTYCQSTPNSTGGAAILSSVGSSSVAANELVLHAAPVPNAFGLFFFGPTQVNLPFGNGVRCVGGALLRLGPSLASTHLLSRQLDLGSPPLAGKLVAGSTWNVQAWFRDPQAGAGEFNLSSALSIVFEP